MNLRHWLSRNPQPTTLRVDGEALKLSSGRNKWADAARAIETIEPERIEALSADGAVLRAIRYAPDAAGEDKSAASRERIGESEIVGLAKVMADAGDRGALRNAEAYRAAFESLLGLTAVLAKRLTSIEMAYHRMIIRQTPDVIESTDNTLDQLAGTVLAQAMSGSLAPITPPAAPPPNGARK